MPQKEAVSTDKAPPPMPFFSQGIKCQGMVYCSGSIGMDPKTMKLVDGNVGDRTVRASFREESFLFYIVSRVEARRNGEEAAQQWRNVTLKY
jgi:enamine deaminase RidA (YjgF/YER057c/UK114 family)